MWVWSVTRTWNGDRDGARAALNLPADQIHMRAACTSAPGQPRARGGVRYRRARRWVGGLVGVGRMFWRWIMAPLMEYFVGLFLLGLTMAQAEREDRTPRRARAQIRTTLGDEQPESYIVQGPSQFTSRLLCRTASERESATGSGRLRRRRRLPLPYWTTIRIVPLLPLSSSSVQWHDAPRSACSGSHDASGCGPGSVTVL